MTRGLFGGGSLFPDLNYGRLRLLRILYWQLHDKLSVSRLAGEADLPVIVSGDNAMSDVEAQAGPDAYGLRSKKWLENLAPMFGRNARALICDSHTDPVALHPGTYRDFRRLGRRVDRIVQQVGPDLAYA